MVSTPVKVCVWRNLTGATWAQVGEVQTWRTVGVEPRHNQPGTWSMSMPWDAQAAKIQKTDLLTFDFRGTRSTGVIERLGPQADATGRPALELGGLDALTLLGDALCWPVPTAALSAQAEAYYRASGPAETVLSALVVANIGRLGYGVSIAPSLDRGGAVTLNERFSNLLAVVQDKADVGGIGVRMGLVPTAAASTRATMTLEFYQPADRSLRVRLSHKVGTLQAWSQSDAAPTGTRAIVAGGGEGTARVFRQVTTAPAEAEWGRKRETFVDARDTTEATLLNERGLEAIADTGAQASFKLDAVDSQGMRYGEHFGLGDLVTVELLTGVTKVDRLRSARFEASADGVTLQLVPGNPDGGDPLFEQAALLRGLRRQIGALQRKES